MNKTTTFTIEEIKSAFWKEFHKSGETYFDYLSCEEECNRSTERQWEGLKDALERREGRNEIKEYIEDKVQDIYEIMRMIDQYVDKKGGRE